MNKKYLTLILSFLFLVLFSSKSYAVALNENSQRNNENAQERLTQRTENLTEKCTQIQQKIDQKIQAFNANKSGKEEVYTNVQDKITSIIAKLKTAGFDTSKLAADFATLQALVQKYWDDRQLVINKLEESKTLSCDEANKTQYRARIQETRELHKTVLDEAKNIRDFVTNTIKPDVQAIKATINTTETND